MDKNKSLKPKLNGFALAGFILSILGFGILSVIFSAIAMSQINNNPKKYKGYGFAVAGLVIGIIWILIDIIILTVICIGFSGGFF